MRARVSLRGLLVEHDPGQATLVPWLSVENIGNGAFAEIDANGDRMGRRKQLLQTESTRGRRVANRLHARAIRYAFHDGTLEIRRCFRSEIRGQQLSTCVIGAMILAAVLFQLPNMGWPWASPFWSLAFMSIPVLGSWWAMTRPPFFGSRGVLRVRVTRSVLGIERRDGSRDERLFDDVRRLELSGVPLIEFRDGTIVRVSGLRGVRAMLAMIQRERFPEAAQREKEASRRSLIRSCVYFMLGGVVAGVMTWYLQGQGLLPASRWRPLLGGLAIGLGMPGMLVCVGVVQAWTSSGVPPWKRKAWTEMIR